LKGTNYVDINYYQKNGKFVKRPLDKIREKNRRKAEIIRKLIQRIDATKDKNYAELSDKKYETIELREKLAALEKEEAELELARVYTELFQTQLSNPTVFEEYVNNVSWEFYQFFKARGLRLPALEDRAVSKEGEYANLMSTKAIGSIFAQLTKGAPSIPMTDFPRYLPLLLRARGIKSVLEIGPGGFGVTDLLITSGIAKEAGLQISAIDTQLREERITELKRNGVNIVRGNALNLANAFPGKKFDLVVAVGVLRSGGLSGQTYKDNAASYSVTSKKLARVAVNSLSTNKNALLCATPLFGITLLRQRDVARFATIAQWSKPTWTSIERAEASMLTKRRTSNWGMPDHKFLKYAKSLIDSAPSLVILKRK
jgi:hypothetical protein